MRYIVILKGTQPAGPPPEGLMNAIMDLGAEATAAGALLDNGGLAPSANGARVTTSNGRDTPRRTALPFNQRAER